MELTHENNTTQVIDLPQPGQSPRISVSPKKEIVVAGLWDFFDALKALKSGKKIHKIEWGDKEYYGILKDGQVQLHKSDGQYYQWIISEGDLSGEDWEIIN